MANTPKLGGTLILPLAVCAAVVAGLIALVFVLSPQEAADEASVVPPEEEVAPTGTPATLEGAEDNAPASEVEPTVDEGTRPAPDDLAPANGDASTDAAAGNGEGTQDGAAAADEGPEGGEADGETQAPATDEGETPAAEVGGADEANGEETQ